MKRGRGAEDFSHQANVVSQYLPPELWLMAFQVTDLDWAHLGGWDPLTPETASVKYLKFWLACRTVSKSWSAWISKIDFSSKIDLDLLRKMNISHVLSLFKFSCVELSVLSINDVSLFSRTTNLTLRGPKSVPANQGHLFSKLTQLKSLHFAQQQVSQESLLCLTNLRELTFFNATHVTSLHNLTKLESLFFLGKHQLTQQGLRGLTRLKTIQGNTRQFFQSGRGIFDNRLSRDPFLYDGEWCDGKREGHGVCTWGNVKGDTQYSGDWVNDEIHGNGIWRIRKDKWQHNPWVDVYHGEFVYGKKSGRGQRWYNNGDSYEGSWFDGKKEGHGIYKMKKNGGLIYDGEWAHGEAHGLGICVYSQEGKIFEGLWENGVSCRGRWRKGKRSEDGSYDYEEIPVIENNEENPEAVDPIPWGVVQDVWLEFPTVDTDEEAVVDSDD